MKRWIFLSGAMLLTGGLLMAQTNQPKANQGQASNQAKAPAPAAKEKAADKPTAPAGMGKISGQITKMTGVEKGWAVEMNTGKRTPAVIKEGGRFTIEGLAFGSYFLVF